MTQFSDYGGLYQQLITQDEMKPPLNVEQSIDCHQNEAQKKKKKKENNTDIWWPKHMYVTL